MKKILVIEDDFDISEIIMMSLTGKYIVKTNTDNRELLNMLKDFQADLIMIDYFVGQKNAAELIEEIRTVEKYKTVPFILFTGHPDIKRLAGEMGAKAWLAKPFNLTDLYASIEGIFSEQA